MAFGKGKESTEGGVFKRFIGVAPISILDINPNKEQLSKLYNREIDKEPVYTSEVEIDGKMVKQVRVTFIVKTNKVVDAEGNPADFVTRMVYTLRNRPKESSKGTFQVIDKYGRTAWVTKEQIATHEIPQYESGPANLDKDYRYAYDGEEEFTNFIKVFIGIPSVNKWQDGKIVGLIDKPEEAEARLEKIANYFNGDISEVKEIISYQPNNKVKAMFGVKTADDGKQYQDIYTRMVLPASRKDYSRLDADLKDRKDHGAYPNTEFSATDIKEYTVEATDFSKSAPADMPEFGNSTSPWG